MSTKKAVTKKAAASVKKTPVSATKGSAPAKKVTGTVAKASSKGVVQSPVATTAYPGPNAHNISLQVAKTYIKTFRLQKNAILIPEAANTDILPNCETFNAQAVKTLLSQPGCKAFRIYFGMDRRRKVRLVLVGVDKNGKDIAGSNIPLRRGSGPAPLSDPSGIILEDGQRCPYSCPPPSSLTGG
jgi:hypothetical protein